MPFIQDGVAKKSIFFRIKNPVIVTPVLPIPDPSVKDCCSDMVFRVFADTASTDEFKNDKNGFLYKCNPLVSAGELKLLKLNSSDVFTSVATLNNNTYGTFYSFAFYKNTYDENYIGYQLEWKKVIDAFGIGAYKVQLTVTTGAGTAVEESNVYCLKRYSPEAANGTVRIEYWNNRLSGDKNDDARFFDYGNLNWYNSLRVRGFFGYPKSAFERERILYDTGQRLWVQDSQEPEYTLKLKMIPAFIHDLVMVDILQSDKIWITDYNSNNAKKWVKKDVLPSSGYEPEWHILQSRLASVELKFNQTFNRLLKRRS